MSLHSSESEYKYEPIDENIHLNIPLTDASYIYEPKSATDEISEFLNEYSNKIKSMFFTNENTDIIFDLGIRLIEKFTKFYGNLLNDSRNDKSDVLQLALDFVRHKFREDRSAYKRNQNLLKHKLFVEPEDMVLGTHWEMVRSKSSNAMIPRLLQSKFHYIPILQTLQSLFEKKEFKDLYFEYNLGPNRHRCQNGVYKYFCCANVYKNSELFLEQPYALQLQIATDDFEICDALGSKSGIHKMTPIYFTIKNLPIQYSSKLSNIHLVSLCRADDVKTKETDFNDLWEHIVREILYLEKTGIQIDANHKLRGTISHTGMDNLGANQTLGFVESFNSIFCRFCVASKKETQTMVIEEPSKLRTIENYEDLLKIVENSEKVNFSETKGIKRSCALNKLNYFHILKNKSIDIMHDLNEGCIPFLLKSLFRYCISNKVFTEEWLQKHIQFFYFGRYCKNLPSLINMKKDNLNQNASQLMCLFRNLGFIFYRFRDNEKVKSAWSSVESLQKIVQICYSNDVREADVVCLREAILTHLQCILDIFKLTLLPKHHLVLHYPGIIEEMGPLCHMNMMRFESKHKSLKNIVMHGKNFINITKTISFRSQAELLYKGFTYCDEIDCGKISRVDISSFDEVDQSILSQVLFEGDHLCEIEWFKCNDLTFRKGFAVLHGDFFHRIDRILVANDKYFLFSSRLKFTRFDSFTHSLIIEEITPPIHDLILFDDLNFKKPYEIKFVEKQFFIFAETLDVCRAM